MLALNSNISTHHNYMDTVLEETRAWMIDILPKLKEIFDPRLEKILKELPADDPND